jgi:hypothetical protein
MERNIFDEEMILEHLFFRPSQGTFKLREKNLLALREGYPTLRKNIHFHVFLFDHYGLSCRRIQIHNRIQSGSNQGCTDKIVSALSKFKCGNEVSAMRKNGLGAIR